MEFTHYPVLYREILSYIKQFQPLNILDCTFGLGGHTQLILQETNANVTAIDCDPNIIPWVHKLQEKFPNRLKFINKKFSQAIEDLINNNEKFQWILGDFGVSTMQIENSKRGFSFSREGPLNMAMDDNNKDCLWLVNEAPVGFLANVIKNLGEERNYYNIAKNIVNHRPMTTTIDLRKAIEEKIYDKKFTNKTLARVFQAIRIYTNKELEEMTILLDSIEKIKGKSWGCSWIYFHSLEGDVVHKWYNNYHKHQQKIIIKPSEEEIQENNPSRSAILMMVINK